MADDAAVQLEQGGVRLYFRRDQEDGITAPDLSKTCTYAEHIVHARGKRSQYTSVSLDPQRITRFGPRLYRADREQIGKDSHELVEHEVLLTELRSAARGQCREERARALQAIRYASSAREGLVAWTFDTSGVERKDLINWAWTKVQLYFRKVTRS